MAKITTEKMKHFLNWMAAYFLLTKKDTEVLKAILSALGGLSEEERTRLWRFVKTVLCGPHSVADVQNQRTLKQADIDAIRDLILGHAAKEEKEEPPKHYRCEGCGREFDEKLFSHSRAEMGKDGYPIEVECGPISEYAAKEREKEKK